MQVSESGITFIKDWEKFRSTPYNDGAGFQTIGYGHLMTEEEIREVQKISQEEALELLKLDLQEAEYIVSSQVKVPLSQHQYDALVSFAYNVGGEQFESSTLLKLLNHGFYGTVDEQLNKWVNSNGKKMSGLIKRRKAEGKIFTDGIYNSKH